MTENSDTTVAKKRGRKKISEGGTPSPRKIHCVCAAIVDDVLVMKSVHCEKADKETPNKDVFEEAKEIFASENELPEDSDITVVGPFFHREGTSVPAKKRDTISGLSMETASFVPGKTGTAVYKEWNVSFRLVQNDPEAVYIIYKTHTTEDKKTKPQNKFVKRSSLADVVLPD